ncbi:hypothetical protein Cgig2_034053 [Carnegiea gigantea]|uniref:non-specific serine/threonine protein kinase n=1 Tax=Carnegiea gigantea TaxID=171969 RepID=A0A9Q1KK36_9CARY|nr:hypothetical protein Cgig2_034053 [Carnegiea gigantea]
MSRDRDRNALGQKQSVKMGSVVDEGGFGAVFKGWIDELSLSPTRPGTGTVIAVKRLNQEGLQGHEEWLSLRMKVILGAAKGLAFLHNDKARVIYRDFKTSNILLDMNYNAKLSDFGLARYRRSDDKSYVSTRVMGTYGYATPEYIIRGRRAIDKSRPNGEQKLVEWARPYINSKCKIFCVMDPRIEGQYSMDHALKAATLALKCLSTDPKLRPNMIEVVRELEILQDSSNNISDARRENRQLGQFSSIGTEVRSCRQGPGRSQSHRRPSPVASR